MIDTDTEAEPLSWDASMNIPATEITLHLETWLESYRPVRVRGAYGVGFFGKRQNRRASSLGGLCPGARPIEPR